MGRCPREKWESSNACLGVAAHPWLARTCIAIRSIPRHTRLYYWGARMPHDTNTCESDEYMLSVCDGSANVDPRSFTDAVMQFANAPGPDELENVRPTTCVERDGDLVAQEFITTRTIPGNTQILWNYGSDEWFSDRGIRRCNAGAPNLHAPRRASAKSRIIAAPTTVAPSTYKLRDRQIRARATRASSPRSR